MATAFIFPGQGSQEVGMGRDLGLAFPAAKAVFAEVDDALGQKLSAIMWDGPKDTLTLTENAQPALMAVSMAVLRVLESERGFALHDAVMFLAGHSLGEYSALTAAGALSLADAARLLKLRGQAMQAAVPVGEGAMAALLGANIESARAIVAEAAQGDVCEVANDNEPGQVVVSGHKTAVDRVQGLARKHGVRRVVPLAVSAPFHCRLMEPAARAMAHALESVEIKAPVVPVVANVTAAPVTDPSEIRRRLVKQVTGTVRWRESVLFMTGNGVQRMVEIGAGKVLSGLVKRTEASLDAGSIGTPADIEAVWPALAEEEVKCST